MKSIKVYNCNANGQVVVWLISDPNLKQRNNKGRIFVSMGKPRNDFYFKESDALEVWIEHQEKLIKRVKAQLKTMKGG